MLNISNQANFRTTLIIAVSVAVLSVFGAVSTVAQEDVTAPTVALPTQRSDGERFVIEESRVKERISGETVVQSTRQDSVALATVEAVSAEGYVLDIDTQS